MYKVPYPIYGSHVPSLLSLYGFILCILIPPIVHKMVPMYVLLWVYLMYSDDCGVLPLYNNSVICTIIGPSYVL